MVKLEDLKGKKIVKAKVADYMPPETSGQLELELDDGSTLEFTFENKWEGEGE